jgi:hypothetical protein
LASSRTITGLIAVAKQPIGAGTIWRFKGTGGTAAVTTYSIPVIAFLRAVAWPAISTNGIVIKIDVIVRVFA